MVVYTASRVLGLYTVVLCTCTRLVYTAMDTAPVHSRVHGRVRAVYVYTTVYTTVHTVVYRPIIGRVHSRLYMYTVHGRVDGRVCTQPVYTAVYMARTPYTAVYTVVYTYIYTAHIRNLCTFSQTVVITSIKKAKHDNACHRNFIKHLSKTGSGIKMLYLLTGSSSVSDSQSVNHTLSDCQSHIRGPPKNQTICGGQYMQCLQPVLYTGPVCSNTIHSCSQPRLAARNRFG